MLGSKFVKLLTSILKRQVRSSSNFASLFIVMTHKSPVNFNLIHFQLWTKGSHQSPDFENFNCSGENLPNSSCHFWKHKPVFLQIFYQILVPWNITSLFFLRSKMIYFGQKAPHQRSNLLDFRVTGSKFVKFLTSILNWQVSSFSNFASFFIAIIHNCPAHFKLIHFLLWIKGPHKSPNFENFKCSGENSSCHFPNHKSNFL